MRSTAGRVGAVAGVVVVSSWAASVVEVVVGGTVVVVVVVVGSERQGEAWWPVVVVVVWWSSAPPSSWSAAPWSWSSSSSWSRRASSSRRGAVPLGRGAVMVTVAQAPACSRVATSVMSWARCRFSAASRTSSETEAWVTALAASSRCCSEPLKAPQPFISAIRLGRDAEVLLHHHAVRVLGRARR